MTRSHHRQWPADLPDDEIEMGVRIRGESGRRRQEIAGADDLVSDLPFEFGDRVALMVNGLGGTPISELDLVYGRAHRNLEERGITVGRHFVGEHCTSRDMADVSITLVELEHEIEQLLAAPASIATRTF